MFLFLIKKTWFIKTDIVVLDKKIKKKLYCFYFDQRTTHANRHTQVLTRPLNDLGDLNINCYHK